MGFFVAATALAVLAGLTWVSSGPRAGDLGRDVLTVFLGRRLVRGSRWWTTDDRGVYVAQRGWAYVCLAVAAILTWIGVLSVVIG